MTGAAPAPGGGDEVLVALGKGLVIAVIDAVIVAFVLGGVGDSRRIVEALLVGGVLAAVVGTIAGLAMLALGEHHPWLRRLVALLALLGVLALVVAIVGGGDRAELAAVPTLFAGLLLERVSRRPSRLPAARVAAP